MNAKNLLCGEFGSAGRTFRNATNIKVNNPQGLFGDFHNSHNRTQDWINKYRVLWQQYISRVYPRW